jgi:hypothetical protein
VNEVHVVSTYFSAGVLWTGHWNIGKRDKAVPQHTYGGTGGRMYSSYSFTTSALDEVSGQRQTPAALCPAERTPGTHCTGGWVGPRAGLDTEVRGKVPCICRGLNLDRPVVQSAARHYTELPWLQHWNTGFHKRHGIWLLLTTGLR